MAIIDVLRHRSTKRTSCTSNEQSLVMINKGTRLPAKRKSAKNEIHNIPFGVKKNALIVKTSQNSLEEHIWASPGDDEAGRGGLLSKDSKSLVVTKTGF